MIQPIHTTDSLFIILETERLLLRRLQAADIPSLINIWTDPEVTRFLGGPRDRDWLKAELETDAQNPMAARFDLWPVVENETGLVVGHCGLLDKCVEEKAEIELNYILASSVWGRGYATEMGRALRRYASEKMGIRRLIALIELGNDASERVAVKVGMHFEKEILRPGGAIRRMFLCESGIPEAT
jgi:[ribosomal protein S5]-alanine N-acetyltransferase